MRPRPRPRRGNERATDAGRSFEHAFARTLGVEPQPGSGSLWYAKLDVADGQILWSLKYSERGRLKFDGYDLNDDLMREVAQAINAPGGVGGQTIPGIATEDRDGNTFVVLRAQDFVPIVSEQLVYVPPSRAEQKRARAKTPLLLRDDEDT